MKIQAVLSVVMGLLFSIGCAVLLVWPGAPRDVETWVVGPLGVVMGVVFCRWGLVLFPRILRTAEAAAAQVAAGTADRNPAEVVGFDTREAVIERAGDADDRLVLRQDAKVLKGLVAGDEVVVLGDWAPRGVVLVTLPTDTGTATVWLRTRLVEQLAIP